MKFKHKNKEFVEVVVPFGNGDWGAAVDGLFDDCPLCQQMREEMKKGNVEQVSSEDSEVE